MLLWLLWSLSVLLLGSNGEVERLKNCGKRDLCSGRTAALRQAPQDISPSQKKSLSCFCDPRCSEYGDCCLDVASHSSQPTASPYKCVPISYNQSIYAISDCRNLQVSADVRNQCTKTVPSHLYHYTLDVPVYSRSADQFFANVYCALCNGLNSSDIEKVSFRIVCKNESLSLSELLSEGSYINGELQWKVRSGFCSLTILYDQTLGRDCVPAISDCHQGSDNSLTAACLAYSLPITVDDDDKIFKNPHCALCNQANISNSSCWRGFQYRGYASLVIIFDFDWDFDSCDIPSSVWDGLHQCCTNANDSLVCSYFPSGGNDTARSGKNSHCMKLSLAIEGYLTMACMSLSIICLILHIILYHTLPNSKNLPSKIVNSLSYSLLIAQLLFLCGIEPVISIPFDACQAVAVCIQFFFLSSFFWMNVMSIDIWRTFSNSSFKGQTGRSHFKYSVYAWGGAGIVSTVSVLCDFTACIPDDYRPYFAAATGVCWFANRTGLAIFFFFPICILLILNVIMFGVTVCWFQKQHSQSEFMKTSGRKEYTRLWLYIKLFVIMGLTWCCGMISTFADKPNYRYPFIVFNGLQGAFLFSMFDLKPQILREVLRKVSTSSRQQVKEPPKPEIIGETKTSKLST